jgi:polyisoprenoid-binding protein YceI
MRMLFLMILVFPCIVFSSEIDLDKSSFKWVGTKVTGKHFGKVLLKSANIDLKDGHINSGKFVIDMNSITCDDLSGEWMDKLLTHLKNDDFFDVVKHPTSTLTIKHAMMGKLTGSLTIKGITNPVELQYTEKNKVFKGILKFDRTKFGVKYASGNFFKGLGDKMIHDEVNIEFKVVLK